MPDRDWRIVRVFGVAIGAICAVFVVLFAVAYAAGWRW